MLLRLLFLTSLLFGGTALAQTNDDLARKEFLAGKSAYVEGNYPEALVRFERAYELSGRAELLYNVGQSADRNRQDKKALAAFEKYLELVPESESRPTVELRVRSLRQSIETRDAMNRVEDAERRASEAEYKAKLAEQQRLNEELQQAPKSRTGLWVGIGVGAAVLVTVGVILAVVLTRKPSFENSDLGVVSLAWGEQ